MNDDVKVFQPESMTDTGSPTVDDAVLAAAAMAFLSPSAGPNSEDLLHVSRLVTVGELAACFAHEVIQPLTMIRGHITMMNEILPPGDPLRDGLDAMLRSEKRITELARRMLNFSRKHESKQEDHSVSELIEEALQFVQPYFAGRNIQTNVSINPEVPRLCADRWQILQVFVNLMQNAIDAMSDSPFRVLAIQVRCDDGDIRISVSDTGCGISKNDIARIFMPFFTTKGQAGTGLGLYITRRVIDAHGGSITVQSSASGTTFTVCLPSHTSGSAQQNCQCDPIGAAGHAEC